MKSLVPFFLIVFIVFPLHLLWSQVTKVQDHVDVFDGRTPCLELANLLNENVSAGCIKIKWRLKLYRDVVSNEPTMYELEGFVYKRGTPRKGKWAITRGTKTNSHAVVYRLDPDKPEASLFFLQGDENVLFFLDKERNIMVGNKDFSYALNKKNKATQN